MYWYFPSESFVTKILGIFQKTLKTQFMGKTCESLLQIATIKRAPG